MKQYYHFLRKYVPNNVDDLLTATLSRINETRDSVIRCHRTVALSRILFEKEKKIYGDYIPDELRLPSFILRPVEVFPPKVSPQLLQQTAHLFAFLHSKLADLFDALMLVINKPEFYYLINSALPALFGYFSSKEHVLLAFPFYYRATELKSYQMAFKISYPFLTAPCTFRYFESSLTPFFLRFWSDSRVDSYQKNRKQFNELSKIYADDLIDLFIKNLHLLPHFELVFFKMCEKKYGRSVLGDFLIDELFKDLSFKFLDIFGYEKHKLFLESVFSQMSAQHKNKFIDSLKKSKSSFEVPELFVNFGHLFINYYACTPDIIALSKVIELKVKLPSSMTCFPVDSSPRFFMFWFKIFPKRSIPLDIRGRPLIFSTTKLEITQNPSFERLWLQLQSKCDNPYEAYAIINRKCKREKNQICLRMTKNCQDNKSENTEIETKADSKENKDENEDKNEIEDKEDKNEIEDKENKNEIEDKENKNEIEDRDDKNEINDKDDKEDFSSSIEFEEYALLKNVEDLSSRATSFEEFMAFRLSFDQLNEWYSVTREQERLMIMPVALLAAQQAHRRAYASVDVAFSHASNLFKSSIIQQDQFLYLVDLYIPQLTSTLQSELSSLEEEWRKLIGTMSKEQESIDIGLKNQSTNAVFWESVEELRTITIQSLPSSFRGLTKSFKYLTGLQKEGKCQGDLGETAVVLANNRELLPFYVVVNSFAMKNARFYSLCSEDQESSWVKFESTLLRIIMTHSQISDLLLAAQEKANLLFQ